MDIFVASAFSKNTTGGNKAGVCLMKEYLSTEQKQKISAKLGYTETTFVSPSHKKEATFQLEYFTPVAEVALCGHATIAAFVVMKAMNLLKENTYKIETKSGMLSVYLEDDKIFMEQKLPQF